MTVIHRDKNDQIMTIAEIEFSRVFFYLFRPPLIVEHRDCSAETLAKVGSIRCSILFHVNIKVLYLI